MLLYIMLYVMLAYLMLLLLYLMLFVCTMLFFAIDSCKCYLYHALSWFIDTLFVYFNYDFQSIAVLLIYCFFSNSMFTQFYI